MGDTVWRPLRYNHITHQTYGPKSKVDKMAEGQPSLGHATPLARVWASHILLGVNVALFLVLASSFMFRGAAFSTPWDGPAVATVSLTVATIVLAAVGIGVALLAVWGYTTLREHAANTAEKAAATAADRAADRKVQQLLRDWGLVDETASEVIAKAYEQEQE
jgi:hypothetical protein